MTTADKDVLENMIYTNTINKTSVGSCTKKAFMILISLIKNLFLEKRKRQNKAPIKLPKIKAESVRIRVINNPSVKYFHRSSNIKE